MTRSRPGAALTDLILEVFRLNGRLLMVGDLLTRPLGQTSARWQVLGALDDGAHPVSQIARSMGLTRQSVQRTADRLETEGLVAYRDNPAHRRAKLVSLTSVGRSALDWISEQQRIWSNDIGARLDATELERTVEVLRRVRAALESGTKAAMRPARRARSMKARARRTATR
jgi:DNA-binding MarR family transcriptional regulator